MGISLGSWGSRVRSGGGLIGEREEQEAEMDTGEILIRPEVDEEDDEDG